MFTINKWLLATLVVVVGEIVINTPSNAQDTNPLQHDTSSVPTNNSLVDTVVPSDTINGNLDSDTGNFTVEGLGSGVTLSPDVIQSIQNISGVSGSGGVSGNGVSRRNTATGDIDTIDADSSSKITICTSDPCVPSGESTRAISLNELADLIENDLQQSLNELAAAEAIEQKANTRPRKFVRRRTNSCIAPTIQARETVKTKLEESQKFIEQMEKLNPNNNIW